MQLGVVRGFVFEEIERIEEETNVVDSKSKDMEEELNIPQFYQEVPISPQANYLNFLSGRILYTSSFQGRILNSSIQCIFLSEVSRKKQHSQAIKEQHFTYIEKKQSKISFINGHIVPHGQWVSLDGQHRAVYLHTPLSCSSGRTQFLLEEDR